MLSEKVETAHNSPDDSIKQKLLADSTWKADSPSQEGQRGDYFNQIQVIHLFSSAVTKQWSW